MPSRATALSPGGEGRAGSFLCEVLDMPVPVIAEGRLCVGRIIGPVWSCP